MNYIKSNIENKHSENKENKEKMKIMVARILKYLGDTSHLFISLLYKKAKWENFKFIIKRKYYYRLCNEVWKSQH